MLGTMEIVAMAGVAILLFGAEQLPKLARSAGQAKKEFLAGQDDAKTPPVIDATPSETVEPGPASEKPAHHS